MMNSKAQGFTLAELLVVTLIGSIVLGAVYQTLTIQERSNRQQIAVVTTQQNTRMAIALLTTDLREVSARDGDILDATSSNIRYRALRKAGIVCTKDYTSHAWANVAVYGQNFAPLDSLLIFQDGANKTAASDDTWGLGQVTSIDAAACTGNPVSPIQRLNFAAGTLAAVDTGGLVRSFVKVGYRLVDTGSGGTLFRIEQQANGTTDSVAVIEDLATVSGQGLRLQYFDSAGTQITPSTATVRARIMRIEIKARGAVVGGQSGSRRMFSDSLIGQVFLRGNQKTS